MKIQNCWYRNNSTNGWVAGVAAVECWDSSNVLWLVDAQSGEYIPDENGFDYRLQRGPNCYLEATCPPRPNCWL